MEHSEVLNGRNEREFPQFEDKKKRRRNRWFKQTWRMREGPSKNLTSLGSNETGESPPTKTWTLIMLKIHIFFQIWYQ